MQVLIPEVADNVVVAAQTEADRLGIAICIAVVDEGGHLFAFRRQLGASRVSVQMSINKAYTAAMLEMATEELAPFVQPGAPFFGLTSAEHGRLVALGGGVPLMDGDASRGAVGVSGGSVEQDAAIATAASLRFGER